MTDCIIIGCGVIGMMSAKKLLENGMSVTLFDSKTCGSQSSLAGAGIISPLYPWRYSKQVNELSIKSQTMYKDICSELAQETNIAIEYINSGLLMYDDYNTPDAKKWLANYKPSVKNNANGLLFDKIMQLRTPRLLSALKLRLLQLGAKLLENSKIENIIIKNNKAVGVIANNNKFYSENIIIANGAWASNMGIFSVEDIYPVKGQILLLQAKPKLLKHIILAENKYLVPRIDGKILIGSTYEKTGFDKSIDTKTAQLLFNFAIKYYPQLKDAKIIKQWAGLRPASTSDIKISKHLEYNNLFINVGHFSNGLNTAPASAELITNLIETSNKKC